MLHTFVYLYAIHMYIRMYICMYSHTHTLTHRFVQYAPTSLERSYKHDYLTEADMGVLIDLIVPETYAPLDGQGSSSESSTCHGCIFLEVEWAKTEGWWSGCVQCLMFMSEIEYLRLREVCAVMCCPADL